MSKSPLHGLAPAVWLTAALSAHAQPTPVLARPDPLDAKASVPALVHASSFAAYRRLSDEKLIPWREANDTVTRIGGWRVYAREAQQPEAGPTPTPSREAAPAPLPASSPATAPATLPAPLPSPSPAPSKVAPPMPAGHGDHKAP